MTEGGLACFNGQQFDPDTDSDPDPENQMRLP